MPIETPAPAADPSEDHHLSRQLSLRDLIFAQVLSVVGSSWVGIAAGLGTAQTLVWVLALTGFFLPMAVAVIYLNREMPLEGGLYVWARRGFGDTVGFLTAWNLWTYGLAVIAFIFSQLPTEFAYMVGPSAAWVPENHLVVLSALAVLLALLAASAYRGLALGKWIHNISSASMMLAFALLIVAPFYAMLHHQPIHYQPFQLHLPKRDLPSLALLGQIMFAASGLEYVAIMAGETKSPTRNIRLSVIWSTPIIATMFILGTASVLGFHTLTGVPINYIAPIPQALTLAFGEHGVGTVLARVAILLMQIRIMGTASFIFTGVTRLPMTAGWDHLIPAWFIRLHPRYRTPTNSIVVSTAIIALLLVLAFAGSRASEAFATLNNAANELYALAYLVMFCIPIFGAKLLRDRIPTWVAVLCGVGFLSVLFNFVLSTYPFLDVPNPAAFAAKIITATLLTNLLGYTFYRLRKPPVPA